MNDFPKTSPLLEQSGPFSPKNLMERWETLSRNLEDRMPRMPLLLPDLLLLSRSGTGRTQFLKLLTDFLLAHPNLMDFSGGAPYLEFRLNYCAPAAEFTEFTRFLSEMRHTAGFRGEFRGIVYLDIDEWADRFEEKHFVTFLEYLADNSDDWLLIFSVTDSITSPQQLSRLQAFLASCLRLEKVVLPVPTAKDLLRFAEQQLLSYRFTLSEEAKTVLLGSLGLLCESPYFDGYKSARLLCRDIVYVVCSTPDAVPGLLSGDDLRPFAPQSEYMQKMLVKLQAKRTIGF